MQNNQLQFGTVCAKEFKENRTTTPHALPIYATSSFAFESLQQGIDVFTKKEEGHIYGRFGTPTTDTVARKIAALEAHQLDIEAEAMLFSSGMAAISTLFLALLQAGDKILTSSNIYGGTIELMNKILEPLHIASVWTDFKNLETVEQVLSGDKQFKIVYLETPTNPNLVCYDIAAITDIAKKHNCQVIVDNTFCTPFLQQPLKFGVDFVIHSTTKYLNGHGNSIAGAVVGKDVAFMKSRLFQTMKLLGTNCNSWDAWLTYNGLKTLTLRMERHSENAMRLADYLNQHPAVSCVYYNGLSTNPDHELAKKQMTMFGGMLSFELKDGFEAGKNFVSKLQLCTLAPTLGDIDTLIMHPASMSHAFVPKDVREANSITDGLIRVSVGLENVSDIIADFQQAL
jgi:methionine-gamma-lyase